MVDPEERMFCGRDGIRPVDPHVKAQGKISGERLDHGIQVHRSGSPRQVLVHRQIKSLCGAVGGMWCGWNGERVGDRGIIETETRCEIESARGRPEKYLKAVGRGRTRDD